MKPDFIKNEFGFLVTKLKGRVSKRGLDKN